MTNSALRTFFLRTFAAAAFLLAAAPAALATDWQVPGNGSNDCNMGSPNCDTIAGALAVAVGGDNVVVGPGTFNESNLAVPAGVSVIGNDVDVTIIDAAGGNAFTSFGDGAGLHDLTISGSADGAKLSSPSTGVSFDTVAFRNNSSDGIECSSVCTDVIVNNVIFDGNASGIRMASSSTANGWMVTNSTFSNNRLGIYQANDGGTSTMSDLTVSGCTFTDNGSSGGDGGIYAEEITDSSITGNDFTGNYHGILIFKFYTSAGAGIQNVEISGNTFIDQDLHAVELIVYATAGGSGIAIDDNTIIQDASVLQAQVGMIELRLDNSLSHQQISVSGNDITFTDAFTGTATTGHGVLLIGNGPVLVDGNVIDGGDITGSADPLASGVTIFSNRAFYGQVPATAVFDITCNRIVGAENGVTIYDNVGAAYGGLLAGTTVNVENNSIVTATGGSGNGVRNGGSGETVDAENNYWGCADGPGMVGCSDTAGLVDSDPFQTEEAACVACSTNADCDDGLACNGVETCDGGSAMCQAGTAVDCDDMNECTTDACNEPGGTCTNDAVADDTVCDDGLTCTVDATCQTGVCDGPADDNMDMICDLDQAMTITSVAIKGEKAGKSNGKVGARGIVQTAPPGDVLDIADDITLRVEDSDATSVEYTFLTSECSSKAGGTKIKCKSTDKSSKILFKPAKDLPDAFAMKGNIKKVSGIAGPFTEPLTATLTYGGGISRSGALSGCKNKPNLSKCKAP